MLKAIRACLEKSQFIHQNDVDALHILQKSASHLVKNVRVRLYIETIHIAATARFPLKKYVF